ncbi:MAG: GGDEF domain-containing protein [Pseudomonadota bacterium]
MDAPKADDRQGRVEEITRRARRALEESARRGIPPDPKAFEVFYAYLEGEDGELVAAVDAMLRPGDGANLDALERIHEAHLAFGDRSRRYVELGEEVERKVDELGRSLARRAETDDAYIHRLRDARDGMSILMRPGAVRRTVRELIETTDAYARNAEVFNAELEDARARIREMHEELGQLRETAFADHLTGLANRRRFDLILEHQTASAPEGTGFCVVLFDLDHFKRINDEFGHAVGDSVLQQFARLIRRNVKGNDTPARYGGEEFAIVLPGAEELAARHVPSASARPSPPGPSCSATASASSGP